MAGKVTKKATKKRNRKVVEHGQAHIQSSFNNTIVTLTDAEGNVRFNEHRTFTVIDATHCESTCNGKKYLIEITEDNLLTVTK